MENQNQQLDKIYANLIHLFNNVDQHDDIHEHQFKKLLDEYSNENFSNNISLSEVHTIECIGKNRLPNATFIATKVNMTKGAISKITAKLIEKGLIKGNHLDNNKKDIYYTLTPQGKIIFEAHEKGHNIIKEKIISIFAKYNQEELRIINTFIEDFLKEYFMISTF